MDVHTYVWALTGVALVAMLIFDFFIAVRTPHEPSLRQSASWTVFYVGLAVVFGLGVLVVSGPQYGGEFFAGWLTEYSLSVDNLFVFVIIMSRFAVPRELQQRVLLVGIALALVMRGIFIALGATAIARFSWVFYLFGAFLVYTAVKLALHGEDENADYKENALLRLVERRLPSTREYAGTRVTTVVGGRRLVTPLLIVMIAIGTTDLLFALDSIPAIFGLTDEAYLVFTANAFALMGLRQLYFLIGGLLERLIYLSVGLSVILGFIGVKLILEALHENSLQLINDGQHVGWAPAIPIWVSLPVIIGVLAATVVASLVSDRRPPREPEAAGSRISD